MRRTQSASFIDWTQHSWHTDITSTVEHRPSPAPLATIWVFQPPFLIQRHRQAYVVRVTEKISYWKKFTFIQTSVKSVSSQRVIFHQKAVQRRAGPVHLGFVALWSQTDEIFRSQIHLKYYRFPPGFDLDTQLKSARHLYDLSFKNIHAWGLSGFELNPN